MNISNISNPTLIALLTALLIASVITTGCATSSHDVEPSQLGTPTDSDYMVGLAPAPGEVLVTAVESATWQVDRAGLINLDHPRAQQAGLESGPEPIVVNFYAIEHPTHGTFIVDSGVATAFRDPDSAPVSSLVASQMNFDALNVKASPAEWLENRGPLAGVFLTHIHLDHIMGLPDVPADVPVYLGPGETVDRSFMNLFVQGTLDGLLDGRPALREWQFEPDASGRFSGVIDVFGDGSFFAIHTPGHTVGSTAYLARTAQGPVLMVGDASHTAWGWQNCVEPGEFSNDIPTSVHSLRALKQLEADLADLVVHLGHQHHESGGPGCHSNTSLARH